MMAVRVSEESQSPARDDFQGKNHPFIPRVQRFFGVSVSKQPKDNTAVADEAHSSFLSKCNNHQLQHRPEIMNSKTIKKPNENDVLLGRGGKNNQWIGNEKLRNLARGRCQKYQAASKKGKSQISRSLVEEVRRMEPPGRFLRKCSESSDEWEDVGDEIAREKASQVLRDAIQARKLFSGDHDRKRGDDANPSAEERNYEDRNARGDSTIIAEARKKDPPRDMANIPVQQSLSLTCREPLPIRGGRNNPSVQYRPSGHTYSPDLLSVRHQYNSYGRMPQHPLHCGLGGDPDPSRDEVPELGAPLITYQYPVTPVSSMIAPPLTRKRSRFGHESPLVQGYHRYPYPTPIRSAADPATSPASMMFTPTTTTKVRGLTFSPPDSIPHMPPATGHQNTDFPPSSARCVSTLKAEPGQAPAKLPPAGNRKHSETPPSSSGRCVSTPKDTEKQHTSSTAMAQLSATPIPIRDSKPITGSDGNQDFDFLFNEEVLSEDDIIF